MRSMAVRPPTLRPLKLTRLIPAPKVACGSGSRAHPRHRHGHGGRRRSAVHEGQRAKAGSLASTACCRVRPKSAPRARPLAGASLGARTLEIERSDRKSAASVTDRSAGRANRLAYCDVIQADGGTCTTSITGAFVALALALERMVAAGSRSVPLLDSLAATSVGIVGDEVLLDLAYDEDSRAQVDMNVVMTGSGKFVEVQATAREGRPYSQDETSTDARLGRRRHCQLEKIQQELLHMTFRSRSR